MKNFGLRILDFGFTAQTIQLFTIPDSQMNRRDVLNIILKVFGVQLTVTASVNVLQLISGVSLLVDQSWRDSFGFLSGMIVLIVAYGLVAYSLIFRTEKILNWMLQNETYEANEFASLNVHRSTVLSISVIVIGGVLVVNSIPYFIQQLYSYNQMRDYHADSIALSKAFSYVILGGVKIILGICLMSYQRLIVNWIDRRRKS